MRIAFVSPNREHLPDPVLPLGLLYMMSAAGEQHERTLIDLCFEAEPLAHLADRLREFRPDLVAIGMRNIQNADYTDTGTTLGYYDEVLRTIRECSPAPIVMGGGGFSVIPHELMRRFSVDYGVIGEGEQAFAALAARLASGSLDTSGIRNLLGGAGPPAAGGLIAVISSTSGSTCARTAAGPIRATTSIPASRRSRPSVAVRCSASTARTR